MPPGVPLLSPSGQAAGLFPGRHAGTPGDALVDADLTGAETYGGIGDLGNTHVHCGLLVIGALVGMIALHLLGFRFAGDVSVGR